MASAARTTPDSPSVGYGVTLNQLVNSTAPDKGVGLQLNIPLRNRAAQAVQIRSELEYRQAQMRLQQTENQVSIEVRNAQFAVEQNRASVASAQAAVELRKPVARCRAEEISVRHFDHDPGPADQSAAGDGGVDALCRPWPRMKSRASNSTARSAQLLDHAGISIDDAARGQVTQHAQRALTLPPRERLALGRAAAAAPQQ